MIKVIAQHKIDNRVCGVKQFSTKNNRIISLKDLNTIRDFTLQKLTIPGGYVHIKFEITLEPNERKNPMVHGIRRDLDISYRNVGNIEGLLQTYIVEAIYEALS